MFTENEIAALIIDKRLSDPTLSLKAAFIDETAPFLDLSDHDFLSLVLLTPSIGIANANNSISLMEEMALNKKARKYSKGGYFMKTDPVVSAMSILIKHYDIWADRFLDHIKLLTELLLDKDALKQSKINVDDITDEQYCVELLKSPFMLVRMLSSFLNNDDNEDLTMEKKVLQSEYDTIVQILTKIELIDLPIVKKMLTKLVIR